MPAQRCKTHIRFILPILHYMGYNSSCSQVGHDLIHRVKSSPEQIKITASICKHILCDDGSAGCSCIDSRILRVPGCIIPETYPLNPQNCSEAWF